MSKPKALDLFCGAGGASIGLYRAGFDVTGVDIRPMPRYPLTFIQGDALQVSLEGYDLIWASPPCQAYCSLGRGYHPDLIVPIRQRLQLSGSLYVIENVPGAPLFNPILLCGSMFGLKVRRHRLFETPVLLLSLECRHDLQPEIWGYYGKGSGNMQRKGRKPLKRGSVSRASQDMGIDWMVWDELREAVPPVYAEFLGNQLIQYLTSRNAERI